MLEVAEIRREGLVLRTEEGRERLVRWDSLSNEKNGPQFCGRPHILDPCAADRLLRL
ncbi:MAG: hypothetical protein QOF70_4432 [Acetobacteraceae bacterium]|nr:hypothetical protein [Acetobacteraceae bacterium]